jgi:hypothetical protein
MRPPNARPEAGQPVYGEGRWAKLGGFNAPMQDVSGAPEILGVCFMPVRPSFSSLKIEFVVGRHVSVQLIHVKQRNSTCAKI